MQVISLEEIIRQYIHLPSTKSESGWFQILCKVCNDHGRKGSRGGFRFDTNKVAYHCFNCGHSAVYDPETSSGMSNKMIQVLSDFGVPESEWKQVLFENLQLRSNNSVFHETKQFKLDIEPAPIQLPSHFYPLQDAGPTDKWAKIARYYLDDRCIDHTKYPLMLSQKTGENDLDRWFARIIIPIFKDSNVIFYIGRDLTGKQSKKYLNPSFSREKVFYGFNQLFQNLNEPLYILEGWFDAHVIDGVALLGNEMSLAQIAWLNKSPRKKVYVPDRFGNGKQTALAALELGWNVATPAKDGWSSDIKDINDAVRKYGKMYVLCALLESTSTGFAAKANLEIYCKHEKKSYKSRSKKKNHNAP